MSPFVRYLSLIITVLLASAILAGCAARGLAYNPAPPPPEANALVYIYRPDAAPFSARDAYFYIDDVNIVDLSRKGYTWFHVPAGRYKLKQKWPFDVTLGMKTVEATVEWEAGATYYYRLQVLSKPFTVEWRLSQVPAPEATLELRDCRLQPPVGIPTVIKEASSRCRTCL